MESTIHFVSSINTPEFTHLTRSIARSSVLGLDAEWKPVRCHQFTFPNVSLLQIACRLVSEDTAGGEFPRGRGESPVFLLDLLALPLGSIYELLRDVFVSPDVLKLGFRFKQDLVYLSSTFCSQGCDPGFDRVEPFLDITTAYNYLLDKQHGRRIPKQSKSLATICMGVLGISLSKELQCSDWSQRPLSDEQKAYAAADALCLLEVFDVFQAKFVKEGNPSCSVNKHVLHSDLGLKLLLENPIHMNINKVTRTNFCEAMELLQATVAKFSQRIPFMQEAVYKSSCKNAMLINDILLKIVKKFADKILLKESDRMPKKSKKKGGRQSSARLNCKEKQMGNVDEFHGPPPWDLSLGGDGCPKFLCDVMVEGLAKHLRCVGIDAAVPYLKRPESRDLIDQAYKEKRVILTRDAKILRHGYLIKAQIYRLKSLLKNEQLVEVIETFQLNICQDQLMSRCTKCNGRFIQKPLTTNEAIEAAKGFQVIPNCLFNKNLEFWQCMECNQLYWEGTQYHNAVQRFVSICKLKD